MTHLAPHAQWAISQGYVKAHKKVFDNSKVSDHFAIIPTLQSPSGLSEAEQKLYDLVVRRFMAVFYPVAEFTVTTRISTVTHAGQAHAFKTEGKVLVKPGWMAVYGKEATDESTDAKDGSKNQHLVPVAAGEIVRNDHAEPKALHTRPPARYNEATLLGAMEGAGKWVEDDELREAMQDKGLGTPATRASIIEGLLAEKYMVREGRDLLPTAKAFQLMTLLRGLQVEELSRPELTGDWEHKLAQMERGQLSREAFMRDIADMTQRMVQKAKDYDRDTIPGNYTTLETPCPNCGGVVKENYRRFACTSADGHGDGCGFSFTKSPAGRTFETAEAEAFLRDRHIGPLEGFRSKAGWPFVAEMALKYNEEERNWRLEFDFGDDKKDDHTGELLDFSAQTALGACPKCGAAVFEHGTHYVCEKAVPTLHQMQPSCTFKSATVILQQPVEAAQFAKLLATGKTDLLDKFVSARTRRAFKAFLVWNAVESKVGFEFETKTAYPSRATASKTTAQTPEKSSVRGKKELEKSPVRKTSRAPKKTPGAA
jgi:DNA topoisomerase-3